MTFWDYVGLMFAGALAWASAPILFLLVLTTIGLLLWGIVWVLDFFYGLWRKLVRMVKGEKKPVRPVKRATWM